MTCHWINPESLERESCLLAIRRLKGSHTYDLLAKTMESILNLIFVIKLSIQQLTTVPILSNASSNYNINTDLFVF
jgi:hypothetical protein